MTILCCLLCGVIAVQIIFQHFERKDLYNRLMSRDFDEYRRNTAVKPTEERAESAHMRAVKKWREGGGA